MNALNECASNALNSNPLTVPVGKEHLKDSILQMEKYAVRSSHLGERVCSFITIIAILLIGFSTGNQPNMAAEDSAPQVSSKEPKKAYELTFIIAKYVNLHEGSIVTFEEMESILDKAAIKYGKIFPSFKSTNGGFERQKEFRDWEWPMYARMYKEEKLDGMSIGTMTPRASDRYDRIQNAADLVPAESSKLTGTVFGPDKQPIKNIEVILLPSDNPIGVAIQDGKNRELVQEHFATTDESGKFVIYPEDDEVYIAAIHPAGFFITTLDNFKGSKEKEIELKPWARIYGIRPAEGDDADQSVHFTCHPIKNVAFHIYETSIAEDGTFNQRFVPPGKVFVQRSLSTGNGSISFPVSQWILAPGESEEVILGAIPEDQKATAEAMKKRNPR